MTVRNQNTNGQPRRQRVVGELISLSPSPCLHRTRRIALRFPFIPASTRVESVGTLRTGGNADRANLHRVREAQVGMAIADHKGECQTADQFYCGGIFSCNSDNSKSTEACGKLSGEAQVSPPSIMPKLNR